MARRQASRENSGTRALYVCFFLSGFAGLIYETVWMRLLRLVTGNSVVSVAAVLAIYMAGLGIGAGIAGRFAERTNRPVRVYGFLEGALGLIALLIAPSVAAVRPIFGWIFNNLSPGLPQHALRLVVCSFILIVPAALLGSTLPVVARVFRGDDPRLASRIGRLYAVNSVGAAAGAFVTGFVLLPGLGLSRTNLVGVAINLVIFAFLIIGQRADAVAAGSLESSSDGPRPSKKTQGARPVEVSASDASLALAAVFVSGLTAMVFEVAWTRVLSLNIGTSAYAFSMILSAFIAGLSLGSLLSARLVYRWRSILPVLAATQVLIGLTALMVSHALGGLPILLSNIPANLLRSTGRLFVAQFAVALLVMLVPTFLLGAMFPMVLHLYAGRVHKSAVSTGVVYAVNTAGSVIGSLAAVFLLIPSVGVRNTILAACLINVAIGAFYLGRLALSARRPRRLILAALPVAMAIAGTLLLPDWNKAILSSGPFLYAAKYQQFARREKVSCCLPGLVAQPRQVGFPLARQV